PPAANTHGSAFPTRCLRCLRPEIAYKAGGSRPPPTLRDPRWPERLRRPRAPFADSFSPPTHAATMPDLRHLVDDTYAEGFRSVYGEILLTGRDENWLRHALGAVTGHASSTIMCDCEAGLAGWVDRSQTPDGRPGAIVQFHVPRF